jgi:cell division protein FtsL
MVLMFLLVIGLVVSVAVLIVWTRNQVVDLGYQISESAQRIAVLQTEQRALTDQKAHFMNLDRLAGQAAKVDLRAPRQDQVIVFDE